MRVAITLLFFLPSLLLAQTSDRFGVALDSKTYPQATAKEALASVVKAIENKRFDYLVAHLADPTFINDRIKRIYNGKVAEQIADTQNRFDPSTVKQIRQFLKAGKWTIEKTSALVQLDDIKDRCVRLVQKDGRWFLSHRFDPPS